MLLGWATKLSPDLIIKNGDAFEIKNQTLATSTIALNSSHPKDKLYHDDGRITSDCSKSDGETGKPKTCFMLLAAHKMACSNTYSSSKEPAMQQKEKYMRKLKKE